MSEGGADLSQIRGDWKFHMDYLTNAVTRTMERQMKNWAELSLSDKESEIDQAVTRQKALWDQLNASANDKGTIPTGDAIADEFMSACRDAKGLCDAFEDRDHSRLAEEFTDACRQTRALCDDLEMMREQRPDDQ